MLEIAIDLGRFPTAPATLLERAVRTVFEAEGVGEGELSLALLEDAAMRSLNREIGRAHD